MEKRYSDRNKKQTTTVLVYHHCQKVSYIDVPILAVRRNFKFVTKELVKGPSLSRVSYSSVVEHPKCQKI